jgi:cation diffusion facilitator family transporter
MSRVMKIAIGSLFVGLAVLGLKLIAWRMTGSIALLSDALESIVNVAVAVAAMVAIRVAALPPDDNHPYGHHKAEFLSAILEGVMIIAAALVVFHEAWNGFMAPRVLEGGAAGLAVNIAAGGVNFWWARTLIREGRAARSPALVADGRHLYADVVSSVGVTAGVGVAMLTGWAILDPIMAALVAVNILWSGWKVVWASMSGLLDEALPAETQTLIHAVIAETATGAVEAHDIKTRHAGSATFIDFHLIVPGDMSVRESHAICDRIETALRRAIPKCVVNIHVEPEEKAKQEGVAIP